MCCSQNQEIELWQNEFEALRKLINYAKAFFRIFWVFFCSFFNLQNIALFDDEKGTSVKCSWFPCFTVPLHSSHMQKSTYEYWSGFAMHFVAFSQASQWIHNKRSILALSHYIDDEQFFFVFLSLLTKTQFYKLIKIAINSRFCISPSPLSHLIEMHFSVFIYLCVALARMCMKNVKLLLKNPPPSLRRYQIKSFQNCFYWY